ncbi:MAG: helix-turn-helix transcriptional regulator [Phycisphaerae bacterium]|nr:helix-turn-helix transcriptional regulator [Phycisphaerae bacterium]
MSTYATSERTKQSLIQAAGELLAERGVGEVSTRAVAERAGVNLGTIHYHFGGKEELFKEVLRFACQVDEDCSLPALIEESMHGLDSVQAEVRTVRRVVQRFVRKVLASGRPRWCSRVVYRVLQQEGPLCDFLQTHTVNPLFAAMESFIRRIRPDWSATEVFLWIQMLLGPIVFHSDHSRVVIQLLGCDSYPEDYLVKLEGRVLRDAVAALGLSSDALGADEEQVLPAEPPSDEA